MGLSEIAFLPSVYLPHGARFVACGLTGESPRDGLGLNVLLARFLTLRHRLQRNRCAMILWVGVVLFGSLPVLRAHDPGISTADVRLLADKLAVTTGFAPDDAKLLLPPAFRSEEKWSAADVDEVRKPLEAVGAALWEVSLGGKVLAPRSVRVELLPDDNLSFFLEFPPVAESALALKASKLLELPPDHRQFVIVFDARGSAVTKKLLSHRDYAIQVAGKGVESESPTAPDGGGEGDGATFAGFFQLGVEHIWTGYDHLLFLFALLIVCQSFRSILAIVSCFTVAHSITLALATLDVVNFPASVVEPMIAASIVFVGIENLVRRGEEPRGRWLLTFIFGLIHGFGFAGVLRDIGVGRDAHEGIAMPLFSFNLGVEIGQIVIAAVVLPLVWQLRKRPVFVQRGVPILSGIVAAAGLFWLVQRTLF